MYKLVLAFISFQMCSFKDLLIKGVIGETFIEPEVRLI